MTYKKFREPYDVEVEVKHFLQQHFPEIHKCRRSQFNEDRIEFEYHFGLGGERLEKIYPLIIKCGNRFSITAENNYLVIGYQLQSKGKI